MSQLQYTATPRRPQWQNLSDRHAQICQRLEEALVNFSQERGTPAKSIVGAYGSGKSELMAWGFHYAWTQLNIPAIYITLETLLEYLPDHMGPREFVREVEQFLQNQLVQLEQSLNNTDKLDNIYLATDVKPGESLSNYFRQLFNNSDLDFNYIHQALVKRRCILFLDEVEQKYGELVERIETSDQAPLREMLQAVEQGLVPFYLVLSFGLSSAYEAMSGADARRIDTLTLPIPDASDLGKLEQIDKYRNFIWWASRGRPGWAVKLNQDWSKQLPYISGLEQLNALIASATIDESIPIIEIGSIKSALAYSDVNEVMTNLLKAVSPISIKETWSENETTQNLLENLPSYQFLIVSKKEQLRSVRELADALIKDLMKLADELKTDANWQQIRYYLLKILGAMADTENRVAFGGWLDKTKYFAEAAIAPLLILLQDMILEFEGDRPSTNDSLTFLDKVMERCKIAGDRIENPYLVSSGFSNSTVHLFEEVYRVDSDAFISLSPKALESLFPRMVGRPLMTLHSSAKGSMNEQYIALEASVAASRSFIGVERQIEGITVQFVFVPGRGTLQALQTKLFSPNQRGSYLRKEMVYVLVPLVDVDDLSLDVGNNTDITVIEELHKLSWQYIGEKRVQDFVISLWHNWITKPNPNSSITDLFEILDEFLNNPNLSKSNRRKLEYYYKRLDERINDIGLAAGRGFKHALKDLFDPEDGQFPDKRIGEALERIKTNRAIEQVILAFDLCAQRKKTLETTYEIRQLEQLRQATKQPNAYKEFLDGYTVRKPSKEVEPAVNLSEITNYIDDHSGFARLLSIARKLALEPGQDWQDSQEGTNNAPLLKLYGYSDVHQIFIRGLSLYSFLADNRQLFLDKLQDVKSKFDQIAINLERLKKDVGEFNKKLDYELLITTDIEELLDEVKKLHNIMTSASELPPSILYLLYRFGESAYEPIEQERQRWRSEHGLQGWYTRFNKMLNWCEQIDEFVEQIQTNYEEYPSIKNEVLGTAEELATRIRDNLEKAAQDTLKRIDRAIKLSDNQLPDADVATPYLEALAGIQKQFNGI